MAPRIAAVQKKSKHACLLIEDDRPGKMESMLSVLLFALAGFLLGGAYTTWKNNRRMAIALIVAAVLAGLGAALWLE